MQEEQKYPLVSIVLSTFNGDMYLAQQLESIFTQTYPNLEVIAADDCSSDGTLKILYEYSAIHKNLQIVESKANRGYIKNFEIGMSFASGKFISACDQDDVWSNNKVALMVEAIGNYPALYCDSYLVDEQLNYLGKKKLSEKKNLGTYTSCLVFATDNCVAGHATLITKEFFKHTQPFSGTIPHDWWFAYLATFYGGIKYLDLPLVKYRNHSSNVIGAVKTTHKKKTFAERLEHKKEEKNKIKNRVQLFHDLMFSAN